MINHNRANRSAYVYKKNEILACPARFERATYALEEFVAAQKSLYFNGLQHKNATVQQTVQCTSPA